MMREAVKMAKYRMIRHIYRNVAISKDLMHRMIDAIDADDDGRITVEDARLALRFALDLDTPTKEQIKRLDYFDTHKVTLATARQTLRIALDLDDPLEVLRSCGRL